jgi:hypothetical protein
MPASIVPQWLHSIAYASKPHSSMREVAPRGSVNAAVQVGQVASCGLGKALDAADVMIVRHGLAERLRALRVKGTVGEFLIAEAGK